MKLRLHTRAQNSAGERVRIALNLKGLAYEYVPVMAPNEAAYRQLNPQGLMPVLEVDGHGVTQSLAIIEFLEEVAEGPSLYPADPVLRARVRAFACAIMAEAHALTVKRVRRYLEPEGRLGAQGAADWGVHWIADAFAALEQSVARDTAFCFTQMPGLAEVFLVPQMANARRFGVDVARYPRLCAVDARCAALPAFATARPERQVDFGL